MKKIVICGYHGFSNSGDEALLKAMIDALRAKRSDLSITVLSMHPESTRKLYDVDSVYRYNLIKIWKLFKRSDLFLFGGGSLLQDITSKRSLYYYLGILNLALRSKIKVMLYGNGIGPLEHKSSRKLTAKCLNKVDMITLRDDLSDKLLAEIGVNVPIIRITADPAFTLRFNNLKKNDSLLSEAGIPKDAKYAIISVRDWKNVVENFVDLLAEFCDCLFKDHDIYPLFIPMQYKEDEQISKEIMTKMKTIGHVIDRSLELDEIFSLIGFSEFSVGMRLHTLIYATTLGVPVIALSYDPKVNAYMHSLHQPLCVNVERMTSKELKINLSRLINELTQRRNELHTTLNDLRCKAEDNAEYALQLL